MKKLFVKKSIIINAPASRVWNVIVSAKTWDKWMLVPPEIKNKEPFGLGSKVFWKDGAGKVYLTGTVAIFEPNKRLAFDLEDVSWKRKAKPGEVTYTFALTDKNGATELAFSLGDLAIDPEAEKWFDAYNTSQELEIIKEIVEK